MRLSGRSVARRLFITLVGLCWIAASLSSAQDGSTETGGAEKMPAPERGGAEAVAEGDPTAPTNPPVRLVVYQPPHFGRPRARVGGGVRGSRESLPMIRTLVPDHAGLTISGHPTLFWFIDAVPPVSARVTFTLLDEESLDPLIETDLESPSRAGIQRIDLGDWNVKLEEGIEYEWSVALGGGERRAGLRISTGWINRIEAPASLPANANTATLASQGLWYDALAAASERIRRNPREPAARRDRIALLEQVGLTEAAGSDRD